MSGYHQLARSAQRLLGVVVLLLPVPLLAQTATAPAPAEYLLTVETDRPDARYHQNEKVTFTIRLQRQQRPATEGSVNWILSKDGVPPIQKGTATIKSGRATIDGSLNEPGFLHCEVTFLNGKEKITARAAGGIDIDKIKPSMPAPDDFDAFWDKQKKRLAEIPINPRLAPVPPPPDRPGVETFDLQADCVGKPVSGYYARPIGAKPKSHPAILLTDGAGVRSSDLLASTRWAQKGAISLAINAHGIPNGKPREFYAALAEGELKDYRTHGRESRDTYYFLGMYLRVLRAQDFLASQPEWDGRTLVLIGGSQGGGQSLAGAGLDPRVTFVVALNVAGCDHTGMVAGRVAGWPKLVPIGPDGKPDPAALEAARYFDGVNFAARVKAPVFGWEGFLDVVAPPTSVYAAYNALGGPKEIIDDPTHGHATDGMKVWPAVARVVTAHLAEQARKAPATSPK